MVNEQELKKNLGPVTNPFKKMVQDKDGDRVMNALDCRPNDPTKQGWTHTAASRVASGLGFKKTAEYLERRGAEKDELKEIRRQERFAQEKELARYSEQVKADRQRERIKTGNVGLVGTVNSLNRGMNYVSSALVGQAPKVKYRKTVRKKVVPSKNNPPNYSEKLNKMVGV